MVKIVSNHPRAYTINPSELSVEDIESLTNLWSKNQELLSRLDVNFYQLNAETTKEFNESFSLPSEYPLFILRSKGSIYADIIGFITIQLVDIGTLYNNSTKFCEIEYFITKDNFKTKKNADKLMSEMKRWTETVNISRIDWQINAKHEAALDYCTHANYNDRCKIMSFNL